MRYLITGKYKSGDDYGDVVEDIAQLAWLLSDIDRFDNGRTKPEDRVMANTIKIETEE